MSAKNEFLCIIPDKPGMLAKRLEVRSQHLQDVKPLVEAGSVVLGGAMLDKHPKEGESMTFQGTSLMLVVESKEAAEEIIRNDIYAKSGVWDLDKVQIIPFKSAVRVGL
ncbi:uncharacterized protein BO80DRAFT_420977 [Aspergillus ibericus CBS 121593]|uniref:YCII-related domain protein n=1 Tax=Aspergillus ibericus CBS 121593 TaxID=1448316 RepID=A0A395HF75_9EURO|nr:YCII-related domain protein [Aspergillus ibericus CBS 121593]RAL05775.1 YCII-related domain protein [Aspergillus ibericus CBS 121593]